MVAGDDLRRLRTERGKEPAHAAAAKSQSAQTIVRRLCGNVIACEDNCTPRRRLGNAGGGPASGRPQRHN